MSLNFFCILFYHRYSKYVFLYLARTDYYFINTSLSPMNNNLVYLTFNELVLKVPSRHVNVLFVYLSPRQGVVLGPWRCCWRHSKCDDGRITCAGEGDVGRVAVTRGEGEGG